MISGNNTTGTPVPGGAGLFILAPQDLALESMGRFGRRRAVLEDISARLRHGAAALKAAAARDNAFFKEVASLQRFWKVSRATAPLLSLIRTLMIDSQDRLRGLGGHPWTLAQGQHLPFPSFALEDSSPFLGFNF